MAEASALGIVDDGTTGWRFSGQRDKKVGFYLSDISHAGHNFSPSIRLERIAVTSFTNQADWPDKGRGQLASYHVFGLGDCKELAEPKWVDLKKGTTDPLGYYAPRMKVGTTYTLDDVLAQKGQKMELSLSYLLTAYGKDPSHEPGGVVTAARIYPTLTFRFPEVTHKEPIDDYQVTAKQASAYRRATAVQALFRLNFKLDDRGTGNQVGLFTDLEDLTPVGGIKNTYKEHFKPGSLTFKEAEKPMLFEVAGRGILHGTPIGWDNIHQWSHPVEKLLDTAEWRMKGVKDQPFTPGLPYGAHCHWRWGEAAAKGGIGLPGGKQYAGPDGPGRPPVDSAIRDQDIQFAIVDADGWYTKKEEENFLKKIEQNPVTYLFGDFSKVWQDMRGLPEVVMPSGDLVIWMAVTAWGPEWAKVGHKETKAGFVRPAWGGTMFANGIFFPHEDVSTLPRAIRWAPFQGAQYLPSTPSQTWKR